MKSFRNYATGNEKITEKLKSLFKLNSVKNVVALPDVHLKDAAEIPSSVVVTTEKTIIPKLTSSSLNCGMGVILTGVSKIDVDRNFFTQFFDSMRSKKNILGFRASDKYDLTKKDLLNVLFSGALSLIDKFGLSDKVSVENDGRIKIWGHSFRSLIPDLMFNKEPYGFGLGFHGNHFLEVQFVDEVFNDEVAREWGLKKGQVVIMYHCGGGLVPYYQGRFFSDRKKMSSFQRINLFFRKMRFHFFSYEGMSNFAERWEYYFTRDKIQEIPIDTREGARLVSSIGSAMNYGYAFRMVTVKRIMDSLKQFGIGESRLLYDQSHNSIFFEKVDGVEAVVHRHNACRVVPGKPVIISGDNNVCSYVCIGLQTAKKTFFTVDHGAGSLINDFEKKNVLRRKEDAFFTYKYVDGKVSKVPHIGDESIDALIEGLGKDKIIKPVVKLRPLATLKE